MASVSPRKTGIIALIVAGAVVLAIVIGWGVVVVLPRITDNNPFAGRSLYTYPESAAAAAASSSSSSDAAAISRIAETPAAIWLLPEVHATEEIGAFVDSIALAAEAKNTIPVFVVYGIPDRDCDNESAGGLSEQDYPAWVSAIGTGLVNHDSIVILEPDSLSLAVECDNVDARVEQIRDAAERLVDTNLFLAAPGPSIYLDAGHSDWLNTETMADILQRSGIDAVRGFATNTSNFNTNADEVQYAEQLSALTGNSHYVIDTSRNGNGPKSGWCNPSGVALGVSPGEVNNGTAQDANLWVKNPGESDGNCNGGPAAGQWWQAGAVALINAS